MPRSVKNLLAKEDYIAQHHAELEIVLREYARITRMIRPNMKAKLAHTLKDFEHKLRPAMETLTWSSMNIGGYLNQLRQGLARLEQLISKINDIIMNKIEKKILTIYKDTLLFDMPNEN